MNNKQWLNLQSYLSEFDQILNDMSIRMLSQSITNDITIDFIACMIPHHKAAIYMCQNLLKYTNYEPLRKIAFNIIEKQTQGIEEMTKVLNNSHKFINTNQKIRIYNGTFFNIVTTMITRMVSSIRIKNINLDFISEMIPHHEGAIAMCHNLLNYSIDPELAKIANDIIIEQANGVKQLKLIWNQLNNL